MRQVEAPTDAQLDAARRVVRDALAPTPVVAAPQLAPGVVLKLESTQPMGSFKVRGALAAVSAAAARGAGRVVTASAGNHALGVAWAATRTGLSAVVVVPTTASEAKLSALATFSSAVKVVRFGGSYDEAEHHALELAGTGGASSRDGSVFVSPYNDPDVIAGQATLGTELLEQVAGASSVIVPVGGGGLAAGVGLGMARGAAAAHAPQLIGVEAAASPALSAAIQVGHPVPIAVGETLADGLAGNLEPGSVTVGLVASLVDRMVAVSEAEISAAVRALVIDAGIVAEGSAAVGVAAIRSGALALPPEGTHVVVITGRNIAPAALARCCSS